MDKEKVYHLKDYNISYDIGSGDQSSIVIAKFLNGTIYVLETFYNEQATLLATILDGFQLESKRLANQNEVLCGELELLKQKYAEIANLLHEKYFEGNCPKIIDIFDKLNKAEIERLNNIIKNAIEFINGGEGWKKLNLTHQEKMLLSILKDSDKK